MIGRHKFASGVADSADTALVLASDWNADVLLGYVLTNRTGGTLTAGDVVAIDSANDASVVLADTAGARRQYVVFVSALPSSSSHAPATTLADLGQGIFLPIGVATVKVAGATTRGNYLRKSSTTKALEDTSVAVGSAPPGDAIATALQGSGGAGTIPAVFRGLPVSPGGNLKSVQVFTANGTWTRPAGIRRVVVEVVGGGGGGGRAATGNTGFHGGAGGGFAKKLIDVSAISSSTITVGAGGTAATSDGTAGGNGGNSSWADGTNTVTGNGGGGGSPNTDPAPSGGSGSGGDINLTGASVMRSSATNVGGHGGASAFGGGGGYGGAGSTAAGQAGGAYGGGGGCGIAANGGAGAAGVVAVWEYE